METALKARGAFSDIESTLYELHASDQPTHTLDKATVDNLYHTALGGIGQLDAAGRLCSLCGGAIPPGEGREFMVEDSWVHRMCLELDLANIHEHGGRLERHVYKFVSGLHR